MKWQTFEQLKNNRQTYGVAHCKSSHQNTFISYFNIFQMSVIFQVFGQIFAHVWWDSWIFITLWIKQLCLLCMWELYLLIPAMWLSANQHPKGAIKKKRNTNLCAPPDFLKEMCLPCSIIIQSCYFDYGINMFLLHGLCFMGSVHMISTYYVL